MCSSFQNGLNKHGFILIRISFLYFLCEVRMKTHEILFYLCSCDSIHCLIALLLVIYESFDTYYYLMIFNVIYFVYKSVDEFTKDLTTILCSKYSYEDHKIFYSSKWHYISMPNNVNLRLFLSQSCDNLRMFCEFDLKPGFWHLCLISTRVPRVVFLI